jgi:hypothetical protein
VSEIGSEIGSDVILSHIIYRPQNKMLKISNKIDSSCCSVAPLMGQQELKKDINISTCCCVREISAHHVEKLGPPKLKGPKEPQGPFPQLLIGAHEAKRVHETHGTDGALASGPRGSSPQLLNWVHGHCFCFQKCKNQ